MPTWLSDPSDAFYLVLFVLVVIAVMVWARNRTRGAQVRAGVAIALLAALFVIDRLVESPREEAVRKTRAMATAANEQFVRPADQRTWDGVAAHISDQFDFNGVKKDDLLKAIAQAPAAGDGEGDVSEFDRSRVEYLPGDKVKVPFVVRIFPRGSNFTAPQARFHVEGIFAKDPDGQYRLRGMKLYEDAGGGRQGAEMTKLPRRGS
ncbi:MAG TPA: hypothetical protein VFG68_15735 [Fimbriiglobus sp.]|nr:hypothetical protein [Fimbriiglobus sp.]